MSAYFGPGGNSDAFRLAGYKSTVDAPAFVKSIGLNAYEYEAGNGLSASPKILAEIGREAAIHNVKMLPNRRGKSIIFDFYRQSF